MSTKTDELIDEIVDETRTLEEKKAKLKSEIQRLEDKVFAAIDALRNLQGEWDCVDAAYRPEYIVQLKEIEEALCDWLEESEEN